MGSMLAGAAGGLLEDVWFNNIVGLHGFTKTARRKFSAITFLTPDMKLSPNITMLGSDASSFVKTSPL